MNLNSNPMESNTGAALGVTSDQVFYGHGKLLLSGEYFALDGARALGVPCRLGQSLSVKYNRSFAPCLTWRSVRQDGSTWFQARFEFWRFNILDKEPAPEAAFVQKLLRQARKQNPHFLREEMDVEATARLDFPLNWGLGSSSTLVHLIAQWAYTGPFELLFKTLGGSGVDVACAQAEGPILYQKGPSGPSWGHCRFDPPFKKHLYFVHQGHKRATQEAIREFQDKSRALPAADLTQARERISELGGLMAQAQDLGEFQALMREHEEIVGKVLGRTPIGRDSLADFPGAVKSLGAWGGDFLLAAADQAGEGVRQYFHSKGHSLVLSFDELILTETKGATEAHGLLH